MNNKIIVRRLRGGTLFKLIFIGSLAFFLPFFLLMGVLALFGASTITWNEQPLTGFPGLISSPFMGLLVALPFSTLGWVVIFIGLWIYSRFKPIELEYIPMDSNDTLSSL